MAYAHYMSRNWSSDRIDRLPSAIFFEQEPLAENNEEAWYPELPQFEERPGTTSRYRCLPILGVSLNVDVYSNFGRTLLKQSYHNPHGTAISEATYTFPLYDGAAVVGFECKIGLNQLLKGKVKRKSVLLSD